jgi:hypothetical protein
MASHASASDETPIKERHGEWVQDAAIGRRPIERNCDLAFKPGLAIGSAGPSN